MWWEVSAEAKTCMTLHYRPIPNLRSQHQIPGSADDGTLTPGSGGLTVAPVKGYYWQDLHDLPPAE